MKKDLLGKRMKSQYETRTRTWLPRRTYTIIRLDGKAFHTFTRGMKKPYDLDFMGAMDETAKFLVKEVQGCTFAYVQSDEISLLLTDFGTITTSAWFDGQVQKMVSVAASLATAKFNAVINRDRNPEDMKMAFFDARVFTIPDYVEVENYFVWRQKDAMRNSISMHAQALYPHGQLQGKSQKDMEELIKEKGEDHEKVNLGFKFGRTIYKSSEGEIRQSFSHFQTMMTVGQTEQRVITQFIPRIEWDLV